MKKRFRFRAVLKLSLIAALVLIVAVSVAAQNGHSVVDSGFCGAPGNEESVTWTLYDDGCCVISGTGDIAEFPPRIGYVSYSQTPWAGDATSIIVEEGVTGISPYLFSYTSLIERIELPSTIVTIGEHAFDNCTGLKSLTVPNGITELDDYIFTGCSSLETIKLPQSITSIGTCCFQRCDALKRIEIPENVTELGSNAFEECKLLESITIPQGVTKIGERAFYDCEALAEIIIPDSVTFVGNDAFENTNWIKNRPDGPVYAGKVFYSAEFITQADADLIIKPGTTQISELAGRENRILQTLSIPGSVTVMGQAAFCGCNNLKKVYIEEGVTYINQSAFGGCASLEEVILPSSITNIYSSSFDYTTNLTEFIIPENASLGAGVLNNSGITRISFPDTMTSIPYGLCINCTNLASVYIPKSIKRIDNNVFNGCTSLTDVYYEGTEDEWNTINIGENNQPLFNAVIHYGTEHNVETIKSNYQAPSCTQKGSYDLTRKCLICGEVYSTQSVEIPKVEHIIIQHDGKAPDCNHPGWEAYSTCSRCDYTTFTPIKPTGVHTPGQAQRENITESTCRVKGGYDEVYYCSACETEISRERKELPLEAHNPGQRVAPVPANCHETGTIGHYLCSVCGTKLDKNNNEITDITEQINPLNHNGDTEIINKKAAGCESKGYTGDTVCLGCQQVVSKGKSIVATGHKWNSGTVTKKATCNEEGVKTYTCSVCKKTRTEKINKVEHSDDGNGFCRFCGKDLMPELRCQYCGQIHSGFFGWLINFFHKILLLFR